MNPITLEWVEKAEGDFATAERELAVRVDPNYDAVCFHAQQCAEKYLKARLQEAGIPFGKTHDLSMLLSMLLPAEPTWTAMLPDLQTLATYAVAYRCPGDSADEIDATDVMNKCRTFWQAARRSLGL
jgi:HEPN domain-containing protein